MKKLLKALAIVIILFLAIIIVLPFAFKGKISEKAKKAINENLNAKVEFSDIGLSLIRSFPDISISIHSLSIEGVDQFKADTLISVPRLSMSINLMSVIKGNEYEVRTIDVDNARIYLKVLEDGRANWDIMKEDSTAVSDTVSEPSQFKVALKRFKINNSLIVYDDASIPTYVRATGVNSLIKGDLREVVSDLDTKTQVADLFVNYDGIPYLSKAHANLDTRITADLDKFKFTFPDAHLFINDLEVLAKGFFAMPENGYDMDISFEAVKNEFRHFLSLVPAIYSKDFDKMKSAGSLAFNGYVKGHYDDNTVPAFGINLGITNGMFKYPDLPGTVENINVKAVIDNPTGVPDATIIDVEKFHLEMMGNPIDAILHVRTPVSDPYLDVMVDGTLNLADVSKFYPLDDGDKLSGLVVADFAVKGNQSDIENQRFNEFKANGSLDFADLVYNTAAFSEGITISKARFDLSTSEISMPNMNMTIGKNDISASGSLSNYLAYAFDKGELAGVMDMQSNYFNINDFMSSDEAETHDTSSSKLSVIEIPKNMAFLLNSSFEKVIYDKLELTNATGILKVKDQTLTLQDVKFNAMQGQMTINGTYSTKVPNEPFIDLAMNVSSIEISETFKNFLTIEKLAPIASKASGKISSALHLSTKLGSDMMPLISTLISSGNLTSPEVLISNLATFDKLGDALKMDQLKKWAVDKINLSFAVEDGRVMVKPFDAKLGNINAVVSGWNSFDQTLEYVMDLSIPRSAFGGAANSVLNNLVKQVNDKGANFSVGETVPVSVLITGTVTDPKISTSIKSATTGLKENIKETIQQKKEEAVGQVKAEASKYIEEANARAQKLLDEAQLQANKIVAAGAQAAQKIRDEANLKANQLIAEGKKKGPIGELAAKKAAETVKSEADKKATGVTTEAQKQADAIMAKARQEAEKLRAEAQARTK